MVVESVFGQINIFVPSKSNQIDFCHFLQARVFAIATMVSLETVKSSIVSIIGGYYHTETVNNQFGKSFWMCESVFDYLVLVEVLNFLGY